MSVVCEEVFDELSHPSIEEIKDYAVKIGIDPNEEPQLLPIAAEGLMKALPPAWKPCFDEKSKSFYYYNRTTEKTQWEHPLDNIYKNMVKKARADSQSISLGEPTDDATYARDDLPSLEEPAFPSAPLLPKKLEPLFPPSKLSDKSSSPRRLRKSPTIDLNVSPRHESKFVKQKSEDHILINRKFTLNNTDILGDDPFEKHPRLFDAKRELKVTGGGSMFLKSNTKKADVTPDNNTPAIGHKVTDQKNILRDHFSLDIMKGLDLDASDKGSNTSSKDDNTGASKKGDKPEDEEDDKKSVRFNLRKKPQFDLSDKSLSDEDEDAEEESSKKNPINPVLQVSFSVPSKSKSPFTLAMEDEVLDKPPLPKRNLKLIKPNPSDLIKPVLMRTRSSESEDDSPNGKIKRITMEEIDLDSENSDDSPNEKLSKKTMQLEQKMEQRVEKLKQKMWKSKNVELVEFQENLEDSQREELKRIVSKENEIQEKKVAEELKHLRAEVEIRNNEILEVERKKLNDKLELLKLELTAKFSKEEEELKEKFETKKEELEKYYEEKLVEIETNLAEVMEKNRDELMASHNSILEQQRQSNSIIADQLQKEYRLAEEQIRRDHNSGMVKLINQLLKESRLEEEQIRSNHQNKMVELINQLHHYQQQFSKQLDTENTVDKHIQDEKYEKLRSEKRLLEDKYKCLKEKFIKLKSDVRLTIEKRNKKKEEGRSGATTATGSETEKSFSANKERTPMHSPSRKNHEKPPTPKIPKTKTEHSGPKEVIPNDLDTSISDKSEDRANKNDYDTSDNSLSHRRSRKKLFSRTKSNSATRARASKSIPAQAERSCSPVENLRRQLQKLEDLEDEFPQNQQSDTYHLRYPFSDAHKFEGSSELEFFRHRIHLERDSIKRAKESLKSQKTLFQQRQKELKLKHGSMARHNYQQLCQEEKDLTDMEVSLHRTRSLLGEKVIRLRHLEQTLQRATVTNEPNDDDATLGDLSFHSASSGISSTEFAPMDMHFAKGIFKSNSFQEPSEIIQSLESLNSEIKEIWEVLRKQQQQSGNITAVLPPFVYPDLGWPVLTGTTAALPAPSSIPTLADRLNNYRQHIALVNAQSTVVTHAANQGATTTLVERTRNLRDWLKQAGIENGAEGSNPQANL